MPDYGLIPNEELLRLKKEIEGLRTGKKSGSEMVDSIENLTKSIETLNELFFAATQEMRAEEKSEHKILKRIEPLFDKLDQILDQNTKIARAIVALTEMIRERKNSYQEPRPRPLFRPARPAPASPAPSFSPPQNPNFMERKEGLFK